MSDLGLLSHSYGQWNERLAEYNEWLLRTRMARDGYETADDNFSLSDTTRMFLEDVLEALRSNDAHGTGSPLPNSIQERVRTRLRDNIGDAEESLTDLLATEHVVPSDLDEETVEVLRAVLSSLNDEVTDLHSRMQPRR